MNSHEPRPFHLKYGQYDLLSYAFLTDKSYRVTVKIFYGCCFFYIPTRVFKSKFYKKSLDELLIDVKGYQDFCNYLVSFLDSCQAIRKFERKGIYLQGQMYLTEEYAYVLGVKKPISNRISDKDTAFMASSFDEEKKIYSQMALFHFKKRVEYYSSLMNLPYKVEVGLSKAIDYLGVNNIRKKKVLFNQALYAFNENVSDAVIVHELAHCFVQNHSKDFYAIVIKYCPNYYASQEIILSGKFNENI